MSDAAECYEKHSDALVRFAASQVGWADADDVVSTAVVGVLSARGREVHDMRAYLYRAVANASARHWRGADRRRRREEAFALPEALGPSSETGTELDVLAALADLSVQQRAVVHLTYWEDLTPTAVAQRLGVSDGTVRRQLARARQKLRTVLDVER
ncbi:MAG: sigma-70 family RNA polymerase sigma factor [Acidimicrobiales bacterium]